LAPQRAALPEKALQQSSAFIAPHPGNHLETMIETRLRTQIHHRPGSPCPTVISSEHERRDSRIEHGSQAHGARFQRGVTDGTREAIILQGFCRLPEYQNLSVRGGITPSDGAIVSPCQHDAPGIHEHRPDRDLLCQVRGPGFFQSQSHVIMVVKRFHAYIFKELSKWELSSQGSLQLTQTLLSENRKVFFIKPIA
jgi:hypothetical protein